MLLSVTPTIFHKLTLVENFISLQCKESIELATVKLCFPTRNSISYTQELNL